jgi:chitin synthase
MSYYNQPPRPGPSPTRPLVQTQNSYNDQYNPHQSDYFDPVDSYYANNTAPTGYNAAQRAVSPSYNNNMAPSHSPTHGRGLQPGDVCPPTSYNSYTQPGIASRPSFSSQHTDFPDEAKSFSSTTHLAAKEYGVGEVIPPLPSNAAQNANAYAYPPRATPSPGFSAGPYGAPLPSTPGGWSNWGTTQWHNARNQLLERRVVKQVQLHNGNLILDVPVPKGVKPQHVGIGEAKGELDSLRYTAATCDPDDFMRKKFTLRQYLYGRKTELFVSGSLRDALASAYSGRLTQGHVHSEAGMSWWTEMNRAGQSLSYRSS